MAENRSLQIQSRGRAWWLGSIFLVFTAWMASTPIAGGWPFSLAFGHAGEGAITAVIAVLVLSLVLMVVFGERALNAWNQSIRGDDIAFEFVLRAFQKPVSFKWDEVRRWHLVQGGWVIGESEGGTTFETFQPGMMRVRFEIDKRPLVSMDLESLDNKQVDNLLAFLRIQVGDKEAPTIVHRDKR